MSKRDVLGVLFVLSALGVGSSAAWSAEKKIHLRDYINHKWTHELVTYTLAFEPGTCHKSSIAVFGPEGRIPFQLSDVRQYKDGFARSARLWLLTDLPALGERVFTVRYGPKPEKAAEIPARDLQARKTREYVEFTTRRAGVRLLAGERSYAAPVPAENVPGPVVGLRLLDGKWIAASIPWAFHWRENAFSR